MATTVGALSVDLDLNSASFINNLKKSTDAVERSAKGMEKALSVGKAAVQGFIGAFAINEIAGLVTRGLDFAAGLGEQAQQLGVTTRELQVYRYAASQVGIAQEDMEKGLAKLTLTLGKVQSGAKAPTAALRELGLSTKEIARIAGMSAGEALPVLADAFSKIESPAKRAKLEVELFGKAGQKIDNLLSGGSTAINELASAADKLGIVLSDDAIAKADETADKLASVKTVLEANIAATVAENADSILELATAVGELGAAAARNYTKIADFFRGTAAIREKQGFFSALGAQITDPAGVTALGASLRQKGAAAAPAVPKPMPTIIDPDAIAKPGGGGGSKKGRSGPTLAEQFASLEGRLDPLKKANDEYRTTIDLLDKAEAAGLKAAGGFDALRQAARANLFDDIGLESIPPTVADMADELDRAALKVEELTITVPKLYTAMDEAFTNAKEAMGEGLINGLENLRRGFGSLKDVALSVLDEIEYALLNTLVYGPIREFFTGKDGFASLFTSGGGLGGMFDGIGRMFGGGKAGGGSVDPSRWYVVGEEGPELFAPGGAGTIIPNSVLRGAGRGAAGGVSMNFYGPVSNAEQVRRSAAQAGAALLRMNAAGKRGV